MAGVSRRLTLPDGRELAYDVHGPEDGCPILLFHGTPSSRSGWYVFGDEALARRLGICVIAPDRPGVGDSTYQAGRRIADWPGDVAALADSLGLERYAVLGYSGGGPYVVACAQQLAGRLTAAGIVGVIWPFDLARASVGPSPLVVRFLRLARDNPPLAERLYALLGVLARRSPPRLVALAMATVGGSDRAALARHGVRRAVLQAFLDALRPGPQGVRHDTALMISPWGIDPGAAAMPIHLWHGEEDHLASPDGTRRLAGMLPQAHARFYAGEGHLSLLLAHHEEILGELLAAVPERWRRQPTLEPP